MSDGKCEILVDREAFNAVRCYYQRALVVYEFSEEPFCLGQSITLLECVKRVPTGTRHGIKVTGIRRDASGLKDGFVSLSFQ